MKNPPKNNHLALNELKYRIESAPYSRIAAAMAKAGLNDTSLKILLFRGFNLRVDPMTDPTLYFAVTEEQMQQIAQDMGPGLKRGGILLPEGALLADGRTHSSVYTDEQQEQILALKIGSSTAIALSEEYAKVLFQAKIAQHNAG